MPVMKPCWRLAAIASLVVAWTFSGAETRLPPDQLAKAIRSDAISIPTPGELFAALSKPGKPNWIGQYRGPVPTTYRNRAQIALNLGGLIADGFIAVEAKDSQQVKNIGSDIIKMAKALGVSENLLSRGNSINEFAEDDDWDTLQEELEATQNEVKSSMQTHSDQGLVSFMQSKINDVSPDLRNDPLVKNVTDQLGEMEKLVSFPAGQAPSIDDVRKVNASAGKMMDAIRAKIDKK
jgi:hypothetical protein